MRMRNALTHATHTFFQNNGFLYVQVSIITTIDAKGFNERIIITMLLGKWTAKVEPKCVHETEGISLEALKVAIKEKSKLVEEFKRSDQRSTGCCTWDLQKTNALAQQLESSEKLHPKASRKKKNC